MRIVLTVVAGPHKGLEFVFNRHDTFLVGRSRHAHFQLPAKDKFFSRIHFMMEVNPPECRLIDMGSHNGTYVNGTKVLTADLKDGDQIRAGHTILRVQVERGGPAPEPASTTTFLPEPSTTLPMVPGYSLECEIGRGPMGTTYLGQRAGDRTRYAVKVVAPSFQASPPQIADFLRAARVLTQLDHPHISRLSDVGGWPGGFFFVSEYVPGENVGTIVHREGPLPVKRAVRWAQQILTGLHHAHAKLLIHRDIKPTNVVVADLGGKEVVKLVDFGVARVYQGAPFSGLSLTTGMLERASFMAPEVLFQFQTIDPLADQYSVAAVFYYLLTGSAVLETPREERRRYSSLLRRLQVPLRERREDVPAALADVIHKALSRTPSQRFRDVLEFRQALLRSVQD